MKYNEMKYNGSDLQRLLKETKLVLASLTRRCEEEMKYNGSDFQRLLKETKLVLASLSRRVSKCVSFRCFNSLHLTLTLTY